MKPEHHKALSDAGERVQKEMSAAMDALEAVHGTDTVIVAHHMAGIHKTFEMPNKGVTDWRLLRSILEGQIAQVFALVCLEMKIDPLKALEVSKGIYEQICMHEQDLAEVVKSVNQQGESNGTKNA